MALLLGNYCYYLILILEFNDTLNFSNILIHVQSLYMYQNVCGMCLMYSVVDSLIYLYM